MDKMTKSFQGWSSCEQTVHLLSIELLSHESTSVYRVFIISFIYVYPSRLHDPDIGLAQQRGFPKTLFFIRADPAGRIAAICQIVPRDSADAPQAYRSCQKTVPQTYSKRPANVSQITQIVPHLLSKSSRGRTANVPQTCRVFV